MMHARSGQSLIDVLIASGIGAILLVGSLSLLTPALRGSTDAERAQIGAGLARGLQDSVRSLAASNWNSVASLTPGSPYYVQYSATSTAIVAGTESAGDGAVPGLVTRYTFDEGSTATLGNAVSGGPSGTTVGTPTATSSCHFAGCWIFSGAQYVDAGAISGLSSTQTKTFWVRRTGDGYILDEGGNNNWVQVVSGKIRAGSNPGGGYWDSAATLATNTWYFIAVTQDTTQFRIYINGALDTTQTMTATSTPGALRVGAYGGSSQYHFSGTIDDLRVYNRALTAAEVQQIYVETGAAATGLTRSFAIQPVRRNSSGAFVTSGGYVDSSTLALTVTYQWPRATAKTMTSFITRSGPRAFLQSDWSGGSGQTTATTTPGNRFASSSAIEVASTTGSFSIDFAALDGASSSAGGIVATPTTDHWAWNDLIGWINFYSSGTVTVSSARVRGYANSTAGQISLDCATSPSGNICGSSNYYVTNNGLGTLAGYGWSDTYGWISFNSSNHGGPIAYGVSVNPSTGVFSGYAWNDLIGWISFNCVDIAICGVSNYKVVTLWRSVAGSGALDSTPIDTGITGGAQVNGVTWQGTKPAGTEVRMQIASSNSSSGPWTYVGPDGTGSTYYAPDPGSGAALYPWMHPAGRYFRYRVTLVSDTGQTLSPRVDDVVVRWSP